jgi:hypothetical protein
MKYKIYKLIGVDFNDKGDEIKTIVEDREFKYDDFDTIEEAYSAIKNRGDVYCNYTILPYIYLI